MDLTEETDAALIAELVTRGFTVLPHGIYYPPVVIPTTTQEPIYWWQPGGSPTC